MPNIKCSALNKNMWIAAQQMEQWQWLHCLPSCERVGGLQGMANLSHEEGMELAWANPDSKVKNLLTPWSNFILKSLCIFH
jgi:hypothetical protein